MLAEVRLLRGRNLTAKQVIPGLWPTPPDMMDMACLNCPTLGPNGRSFGYALWGGGSLQ